MEKERRQTEREKWRKTVREKEKERERERDRETERQRDRETERQRKSKFSKQETIYFCLPISMVASPKVTKASKLMSRRRLRWVC